MEITNKSGKKIHLDTVNVVSGGSFFYIDYTGHAPCLDIEG